MACLVDILGRPALFIFFSFFPQRETQEDWIWRTGEDVLGTEKRRGRGNFGCYVWEKQKESKLTKEKRCWTYPDTQKEKKVILPTTEFWIFLKTKISLTVRQQRQNCDEVSLKDSTSAWHDETWLWIPSLQMQHQKDEVKRQLG